MRALLVLVALAAMVSALSGCATPDKRIEERQELFDTYPPDAQAKIRAGHVAPGFTEDMVWMALGDPDDTSIESTEQGEAIIWVYTRSSPGVGLSVGGGSYGGGGFGGGGGVGVGSSSDKEYEAVVHFRGGVVTYVRQATDE
jgi:hypothetical protein